MELESQNQDAYDDLLSAIEAGQGRLSLLIAVCDDSRLRTEIIQRYEAELRPEWQCHQVTLAREKPSIKTAVASAVPTAPTETGLVTVLGAEQLHFLKFEQEKSEQEEFLGYLQWTREALRNFPTPIVLWLTNQLVAEVSKSAQDFWSWRKDVFRFSSKKTIGIAGEELADFWERFQDIELPENDAFALPLSDLERMIEQTTAKNPNDPLLADLYFKAGNVYFSRAESGEFQQYQPELKQGITYYQKALKLQRKIGLREEKATTITQIAYFHYLLGNYREVESLLQQALTLRQKLLDDDHPDVATSLNNLAELYRSQGRYREVEPLLQQALALRQKLLGSDHPDVATSLNNLAGLYESQGRYSEAEPLYQQALRMSQQLLGNDHPAVATILNNLAGLYCSQSRYGEAEPLYQQCLEIDRANHGNEHPDLAQILNNLALLYQSQGRYSEAEPFYQQALALWQQLLGNDHPNVASGLNNLGMFYFERSRLDKAKPLLEQSLEMRDRLLGPQHPDTIDTHQSLEDLRQAMAQQTNA